MRKRLPRVEICYSVGSGGRGEEEKQEEEEGSKRGRRWLWRSPRSIQPCQPYFARSGTVWEFRPRRNTTEICLPRY